MAESKAAEQTGLTDAEKRTLDKLMAKAVAANPHGPAVRIGEPYVALTNLSLPRRDDKDKMCDLVMAGETVYLTPDEVALFERHEPRDGRRVSVIRKKSEVDANNPPKPHPSFLSGPIFRPQAPPPGTDMPRPDPQGSSQLLQYTTGLPVPEAAQPQPGSENVASQDAVDILPGGQLARDQIRQGADQDLMAAVRQQGNIDTPGEPGTRGRR